MKPIREYLEGNTLLFDGGMGTYYAARSKKTHRACEWANLTEPEEILAIHREYLQAGCRAIKTNTFGANRINFPEDSCEAIIAAGFQIAAEAAGEEAYVFADVGPIEVLDDRDMPEEYRFVVDCFLKQGAEHFLFETYGSDRHLHELAAYIREKCPHAFILTSFAVQPDGFTRGGSWAGDLFRRAAEDENIDACGVNCVISARHMVEMLKQLGPIEGNFSAMPNAGYPSVRGNRTFYDGAPDYFGTQVAALHAMGAKILGGCCGTTPEHIAAVRHALQHPVAKISYAEVKQPHSRPEEENPFWEALCDPGQRPFAVELDPPDKADTVKFMAGAEELRLGGAEILTIADCPIARARMDASMMAAKLRRELGADAIPHMTCRDRNLNATQALLLGLCAEGIRNVLVVTGDPIPTASRDEVKSVYNFNSRKLIRYVDALNRTTLPVPFHIFAALNVNVRNFDVQLEMARQKEAAGAAGFFTQPILTPQGFENLLRAREALQGKLLGGIMPIVSQRNALFMNSEIAGISVDEKLIDLYAGADRERGEELAVEISAEIAKRMREHVDGYYLMTPFGRTGLVSRIMAEIRRNEMNS